MTKFVDLRKEEIKKDSGYKDPNDGIELKGMNGSVERRREEY